MSDDTTPNPDPSEPDERDEPVAAALAVEPLDELTRRRLVRDAIAEAGGPGYSRSRLVAAASVAAAVLIGVIAGVLLVNRPDQPVTTAAAPAKAGAGGTVGEAANPSANSAPEAQRSAGVSFTPLGFANDVTGNDRLRARIEALLLQGGESADSATPAQYVCADSQPEAFGLVAITAAATGTYRSEPVTIVVGTAAPDGRVLAVVVRPSTCEVLTSVTLQQG
jgi:hypothetical protein